MGGMRAIRVAVFVLSAVASAGDATIVQVKWAPGEAHRVTYDLYCNFSLEETSVERRDPSIGYGFHEQFKEVITATEGGEPTEVERTYQAYDEDFPDSKDEDEGSREFLDKPLRLTVKQGALTPSGKDRRGFPKTLGKAGSWCRWERLLHGQPLETVPLYIYDADALRSLIPRELSSRLVKPQFCYTKWQPAELDRRPAIQFDLALVTETKMISKGKIGLFGFGTFTITLTDPKVMELRMEGTGFCPERTKMWTGKWTLTLTHEPWTPPAKPAQDK